MRSVFAKTIIVQKGLFLPGLMIVLGLLVSSCAVGPDFRVPDAPPVERYTSSPMPEYTEAADKAGFARQRFLIGSEVSGRWWTLFRSKPLNDLIDAALKGSPDIELAQARLREARENRTAQFGTIFPAIDAGASVSRHRLTGAAQGQPDFTPDSFMLYNVSVGISYTLDIFGGLVRQLESRDALVAYEEYRLEGAYLMLTANVVTAAFAEASLSRQVQTTRNIIGFQREQLRLIEARYNAGAVAYSDVLAQRAQVAQNETLLPALEKNLVLIRHQLASLIGKSPGEITLPQFNLDDLFLPQDLPVSLPSDLVRQRPDIKAAEALLHSASAQIGVATVNLYPQITLTGSYGFSSNDANRLFDARSVIWNLGAGILQPVFRGGELLARRRAAIAAYDQALAQYRQAVLNSFQNVADALRILEFNASALKAQSAAFEAARDSLDLARRQYAAGAVSYLFLLNAERQYAEAGITLVQAQTARFSDTAALFAALGGGWWNRDKNSPGPPEQSQEARP